jgi:FkbM family methyltransferase
MSLLFAKMVGEEGQVLSFEADEYAFSILQRNLVVNMANNVRACLAAVWDRSGQELFYPVQDFKRFKSYGSYGIDPNATVGRKVRTLAIDDLEINQPISLMKVDAQGSDLFVLRGAVATIRQHRMPIIFEYEEQFQKEFGTTFQDYVDFVRSISYRFERTIYDINYLIVPSEICATRSSADLGRSFNA